MCHPANDDALPQSIDPSKLLDIVLEQAPPPHFIHEEKHDEIEE